MFKTININYLILYLYIDFLTYQTRLINSPISSNVILFSILGLLFIQNINFTKYNKNIFLFILLLLFSILTFFITPNKLVGFKEIVSLGSLIVFVYIILYRQINYKYFNTFLKYIIIFGILYIFISVIFFKGLLDYKGEFEGLMHNRHNVSSLLGIYGVFILVYLFSKKKFYLYIFLFPFLLLDLYLIFYSYARSGFFIIMVFLIFIIIIKLYKTSIMNNMIFFISLFLISLYFIPILLQNKYIIYAMNRGLTGRNEIASSLLNYMYLHNYTFFIGSGIGSLDTLGKSLTTMSVRDVNNIVGVLFEYGIIGLSLFFSIFIIYFYKLFILIKYSKKIDYLLLVPLPIIFDVSETSWLNFNNFSTIIMYVFIAYTFKQYAQLKKLGRKKFEN